MLLKYITACFLLKKDAYIHFMRLHGSTRIYYHFGVIIFNDSMYFPASLILVRYEVSVPLTVTIQARSK